MDTVKQELLSLLFCSALPLPLCRPDSKQTHVQLEQ